MNWPENITEKQRRFIMAYLGEAKGNATEAARIAGYKGSENTLASVGKENLRKPHIFETITKYRKYLITSEKYPVVDPIRIHREWLGLLTDPETSRTEKITLLRDAARAAGMFKDTLKLEHFFTPDWDPEKGDAKEFVLKMIQK